MGDSQIVDRISNFKRINVPLKHVKSVICDETLKNNQK